MIVAASDRAMLFLIMWHFDVCCEIVKKPAALFVLRVNCVVERKQKNHRT